MVLRSSFSSIPSLRGSWWGITLFSPICVVFFFDKPPPLSAPPSIVDRGVVVRRLRRVAAAFGFFRCAFFLAMASSRRPSEWASLRCDSAYMFSSPDSVLFSRSSLARRIDRLTWDLPSSSDAFLLLLLAAQWQLLRTFIFRGLLGDSSFLRFLLSVLSSSSHLRLGFLNPHSMGAQSGGD